jgi:hypothetical protein
MAVHSELNIEQTFPPLQLNQLAEQESHNKHFHRPATYVHKWCAQQLGSVFRTIILATLLPPEENAWDTTTTATWVLSLVGGCIRKRTTGS